jgi:hypothetical protein
MYHFWSVASWPDDEAVTDVERGQVQQAAGAFVPDAGIEVTSEPALV